MNHAPMLISSFGVARGERLRFVNAEGVLLHVREGAISLTQHGHGNDIVLRAGQTFELAQPELTLAQALADDAALTVAVPERAKAAILYLPETEGVDVEEQAPATTPMSQGSTPSQRSLAYSLILTQKSKKWFKISYIRQKPYICFYDIFPTCG